MREPVRTSLAQGLVILVTAGFFGLLWWWHGAYFVYDIVTAMAPLEELYGRYQAAGAFPLWVPEIHGGYPLHAFGQLSFLYPPHVLLRSFFSGVLTLNISLALHVMWGAIGMWWLLRRHHLDVAAAVTGALLFVFGGAVTARFSHIGMVLPLMWLPWALLGLRGFLGEREHIGRWLLLWIGANVLAVLAGHPQIAVIVLLIQVIWFLTLLWPLVVSPGRLLGLVSASAVVMGLLLPHILPMLSLVPSTDRAPGVSDAELFEFSAPLSAWRGVWDAHPFGRGSTYHGPKGEGELALYLGPGAVVAAGLALLFGQRWRRLVLPAVMMTVLGASVALGEHFVVYGWLVTYTPLKFFALPVRYFILTHSGLVVLTAVGIHLVPQRWRWAAVAVVCVPVLLVAWQWEQLPPWSATATPVAATTLLQRTDVGRVYSWPGLVDPAPHADFGVTVGPRLTSGLEFRQTLQTPYEHIARLGLKLSTAAASGGQLRVTLVRSSGDVLTTRVVETTSLPDSDWAYVSLADLPPVQKGELIDVRLKTETLVGQPASLIIHTNPDHSDYEPTGELSICRAQACEELRADGATTDSAMRLEPPTEGWVMAHELLAPHVGAGYGVPSAQWMGALPIVRVADYLARLPNTPALMARLGVTHIVTWSPPRREEAIVGAERLTEVDHWQRGPGFVRLFQYPSALPRFQLTRTVAAVPAADQLTALLDPALPLTTVVADIDRNREFTGAGDIDVRIASPRYLEIVVTSAAEEFLVVRDLHFPGWEARIDGAVVPINTVDHLWRGVNIPAGTHTVTFRYQPDWIPWALAGSTAAFAGLLLILLVMIRLRRF